VTFLVFSDGKGGSFRGWDGRIGGGEEVEEILEEDASIKVGREERNEKSGEEISETGRGTPLELVKKGRSLPRCKALRNCW